MRDAPGVPVAIRALRAEDTQSIIRLYAACMATEPDIGPITAEMWDGSMRLARFGYGRDFLVALDGTDVVGLAESSLRDGGQQPCRLVKILVHPAHRRRGLGTRLLRATLDQGPSSEPVLIESLPRSTWAAGLAFLSRFGFAVTETEVTMRCSVLRPLLDGPAGLEIARSEPEIGTDRAAEIHNAAYRNTAGFVSNTGPEMLDSLRGAHLWTARLDGTVVAFTIIEFDPDVTWLESLAVDPPYQGHGIGGVLATRALLGDGVGDGRPAGLSVSSLNTAARTLYGRLGFEKSSERPRYGSLREDLLVRLAG